MSRKPVLTKRDFVRRYARGEFGNASPTWSSFQDWFTNEPWRRYGKLFHVRNRIAAGRTWYDVWWSKLWLTWFEAVDYYGESNLYISAMAPTDKTVLQGEVCEGLWGLDLTYTTVAKPMRDALVESSTSVSGLVASLVLKHYLSPADLDWLNYLLEEYPDHVVEFSTYSVEWGTIPGYNTVFWEVRKY